MVLEGNLGNAVSQFPISWRSMPEVQKGHSCNFMPAAACKYWACRRSGTGGVFCLALQFIGAPKRRDLLPALWKPFEEEGEEALVSSSNRGVMASFQEAPPGDPKAGEKTFKTKCAQCHTVDKGAGPQTRFTLTSLSFILAPNQLSMFLEFETGSHASAWFHGHNFRDRFWCRFRESLSLDAVSLE